MLAMKKGMLTLVLFFASTFLISNCSGDYGDLIVCNSCPNVSPWSVWSLDLSNPCFKTKAECEAWAKVTLPDGSKCRMCND